MTSKNVANVGSIVTTPHVPEITYRGKRVVTTEFLANGYGATEKTLAIIFSITKAVSKRVNITSRWLARSFGI